MINSIKKFVTVSMDEIRNDKIIIKMYLNNCEKLISKKWFCKHSYF